MDSQTRTLARRYLKGLMRLAICRAKLGQLGPDDPVWGPTTLVAQSFEQEAREAYHAHVRGKDIEAIKPAIILALQEAAAEAALPYADVLDKTWLDEQIKTYLATFDPMLLTPTQGEA